MLKKLSLAALVAMGGMSFASATPLTEAIKNVDLNGMLRIRFYNEQPKDSHDYRRWRTNGIFIFKVPVAENVKFVVRNSVESNVYTHDDNLIAGKTTSVDTEIKNNLLFMSYTNGKLNAILGKIPVATPVTSADPAAPGHGAGVIATYKASQNFTGAAFFIDALRNPNDNVYNKLGDKIDLSVVPHNIAGAAGIFNTDMVNGQIWYFNVNNVVDALVTLTLNATPIENVDVRFDYVYSKLNDSFAKAAAFSKDPKNYFNISAKTTYDAFCGKIGYAYSDKHTGIAEFSADAPIGAVIPTANNYNIANKTETSSIYGKVGYMVDPKTKIYLAAQYQNAGKKSGNKDNDLTEVTFGGSYQMNKKLSFNAYYDIADWKSKADYADNKEFRFEAKYTF